MDKGLYGLIPAIVIPFDEQLRLEQDIFEQYLEIVCSAQIASIAVNTDAGEGAFLSQSERERILKIVKRKAKNIPVVCGLGAQSTQQAVEYGKRYKDCGADYFLVFPHFAFRGAKGIDLAALNYHLSLSKIGVPVILFQLQEDLGGVQYSDETLAQLAQIDNVVAIKEATFDALKFRKTKDLLESLPEKITLLTGNDNFIIESFILGAQGALIGFGSVFTDIQAAAINLALEKKFIEAMKTFEPLAKLCEFCFSPPVRNYRVRMKYVLKKQKIFKNTCVQPPLMQIDEREKKAIDKILREIPL
ncbi:MAG: dihydrodipicolinate synthase family protein [Candidatus Omnitrophica bacterium]|nr:dihydrodipicolinate synthase family protein [Candidatus Omnitrophota bacterium]MCM8829241.1 dihydrodipicolinate synthase family protein [Candidatus Omnitrophota bacterium]